MLGFEALGGHSVLQATVFPSGHTFGVPSQRSNSQPRVFGAPAEQVSKQDAPGSHSTWHGPDLHSKSQVLPRLQRQVPFAHSPAQLVLGAQSTWQGGATQRKSQLEPEPHSQSPLAHSALQWSLSPSHLTWHGGASHQMSQLAPRAQ